MREEKENRSWLTKQTMPSSRPRLPAGSTSLAGIWLIMAPFLLGYSELAEPTWNDILVGVAVVILAGVKLSKPLSAAGISWVNVILGVWLIIAPFVLQYEVQNAMWNDIILGCIIAICGIWSAVAARGSTGTTATRTPTGAPPGTRAPAGTHR
jgi:hypothetical protein